MRSCMRDAVAIEVSNMGMGRRGEGEWRVPWLPASFIFDDALKLVCTPWHRQQTRAVSMWSRHHFAMLQFSFRLSRGSIFGSGHSPTMVLWSGMWLTEVSDTIAATVTGLTNDRPYLQLDYTAPTRQQVLRTDATARLLRTDTTRTGPSLTTVGAAGTMCRTRYCCSVACHPLRHQPNFNGTI